MSRVIAEHRAHTRKEQVDYVGKAVQGDVGPHIDSDRTTGHSLFITTLSPSRGVVNSDMLINQSTESF